MIFRVVLLLASVAVCSAAPARAAPFRAAIFDLEFVDTSLDGQMLGTTDAERQRLAMLSQRLRAALDASELYDAVDMSPVLEASHHASLQSCGGCDRRMARELGADVSVTGIVQKVSNLILNINIYVRDAKTGALVNGGSADIRSNTDESWTRGLDWLLKHRLLPPETTQ